MPNRIITIIAFLIATFSIGAISIAQPTVRPDTKWSAVAGLKFDGYDVYVDINSVKRSDDDSINDYAAAGILLVPVDAALQFKNKKGTLISAMAVARYLIIDCKEGLMTPIADFYFDTKTPDQDSKPIGSLDYSKAIPIDILPHSSILYKTLCPNFKT